MIVPLILLALVAILLIVLAQQPAMQTWAKRTGRHLARRTRQREKVTVVRNGEAFETDFQPREHEPEPDTTPPPGRRAIPVPSTRTLMLAVVALLVVLSVVVLPRSLFAPRDQFLVLVAPFSTPAGTVGADGQAAARELAEAISQMSGPGVSALAISGAPGSQAQAEERLRQDGADALIYGTIAEGGMLDQESLTPMLIYNPSGEFAPDAWQGFDGRFAMPRAYALSSQPINGKVVLPLLVRALARYGAGDFDGAYGDIDRLINDYPAVAQPLPRALRGNIMWAVGNYTAAADEYQRTGAMSTSVGQASEMALLANNLGAIFQDTGNPASEQAFAQATALLAGQPLPELRLNLARDMLARQRYDEAITTLEPIRNQSQPAPVQLALVDAYLGARRFDDAELLLDQADRQATDDAQRAPDETDGLVKQRLEADIAERRVRLELGRAVGTNDQLLWELITGQALSSDELNEPQDQLEALIQQTDATSQGWQRIAAAADVNRHVYQAQIANQQARLSEAVQRERRKLLAAINLDIARERGGAERAVFDVYASLRGQQRPVTRIQQELIELQQLSPNDVETNVLLGFAQLAADQRDPARQTFEQINSVAGTNPEPPYAE